MTLTNSLGLTDIVEYYRMLERRLARLERGTQGSTGGDDPAVITSLTITGLTLGTQTVIVADDFYRVMMRYSWTAVPDDPSEYNKNPLDGYLTSYSLNGVNYTAELFTTNTALDVGPFTQGQSITFRVRARTKKGTLGGYTSTTNSTTTDATAPFQPSTPVVTPYLGQLAIDWNGLDVSAGQPPTDFRFVEVHLSTTGSTFTPTVATLVGTILRGGGTWVATDLTYGSTYYARLVAVDTVGNRSPASTAGSAVPELLVNADVGPNAIDTANIVNLAVNNAKISDLSVGKLTVGTLTANMTVGARIMTASTGARVELNTNGIQAFNSSSVQTVDIASATGAATITGAFKTDFSSSTTPHLEMLNSGDRTTIYFTDNTGGGPAAAGNAFMNTPLDGSNKCRVGINSGTFTYLTVTTARQRLFLNTVSGIQLETTGASGKLGFCLDMGDTTMSLQRTSSAANLTGGSFEASDVTFNVRRYGGGVLNGGQIASDTNSLYLDANASGSLMARIQLDDNQGLWFKGKFKQDNADSGVSALYTGVWNVVNISGGGVVNYGVTMATTPRVLFMVNNGSGTSPGAIWVFAQGATSFELRNAVSLNVNITYWCIRLLP